MLYSYMHSRVSRVHTVYRVHFKSADRVHGLEIQYRSSQGPVKYTLGIHVHTPFRDTYRVEYKPAEVRTQQQ